MNRFAPLLLSLSLLTAAESSLAQTNPPSIPDVQPPRINQKVTAPDLNNESTSGTNTSTKDIPGNGSEGDDSLFTKDNEDSDNQRELEQRVQQLEDAQQIGLLFGIPHPLLLAGGSGLIGLIGLVLSITAILRLEAQKAHVKDLGRRNKKLVNQIGGLEVQMEQERIVNQRRIAQAERIATQARPIPSPPVSSQAVRPIEPTTSPQPTPEPAARVIISKAGLINALNSGDRQQLREAAKAELNITNDSENAIATGRSITTELEVVPGGGSYWLVLLQGQAWLFPTEKTLKGFTAVQRSKGIFDYEEQTIANPQLLEPALLEELGNKWSVMKIGKIGIP